MRRCTSNDRHARVLAVANGKPRISRRIDPAYSTLPTHFHLSALRPHPRPLCSFDKKVKLWDGRSGKFLVNYNGHVGSVYQVCWSSDSRYISSASKDSTVKIWPAKVGGEGGALKPHAVSTLAGHADEVYALDWAPNGEILASGSKDRLVKLWRN